MGYVPPTISIRLDSKRFQEGIERAQKTLRDFATQTACDVPFVRCEYCESTNPREKTNCINCGANLNGVTT